MSQSSQIKTFDEAASNPKTKYPPPYSMRFTWEERAILADLCGSRRWSSHIREKVFGEQQSLRKRATRKPSVDQEALSRVLGELGRSRITNNLNQITKAINQGTLPVTPQLNTELRVLCTDIQRLRSDIIAALGLKVEA